MLTPRQQKNGALHLTIQRSVGAVSDPTSNSHLAAIEDVLEGLSPAITNNHDNNFNSQLGSLVSLTAADYSETTNLMRGTSVLEPSASTTLRKPMQAISTSDK